MWGLRIKNSLWTNVPFAERHSVLFLIWADMKRHIREKSLMNVRCVENILVIHLFWEDTEKYIQEKNHILVIFVAKNSVRGVRWTCIVWSPILTLNSFPTSGYFCHLLITFANSLDPDQAQQHVGPDLDPNCLTLWWYSWKICFVNVNLKKKIYRWQKSRQKKKKKKKKNRQKKKMSMLIVQMVRFCYCMYYMLWPEIMHKIGWRTINVANI